MRREVQARGAGLAHPRATSRPLLPRVPERPGSARSDLQSSGRNGAARGLSARVGKSSHRDAGEARPRELKAVGTRSSGAHASSQGGSHHRWSFPPRTPLGGPGERHKGGAGEWSLCAGGYPQQRDRAQPRPSHRRGRRRKASVRDKKLPRRGRRRGSLMNSKSDGPHRPISARAPGRASGLCRASPEG